MRSQKFNKTIIDAAIQGFEEQKRQIDIQIQEVRDLGISQPAYGILEMKRRIGRDQAHPLPPQSNQVHESPFPVTRAPCSS